MPAQHTDNGPQIDGEPMEPDNRDNATGEPDEVSDGESGEDEQHPFTAADYEAAVAELATESEPEPGGHPQGLGAEGDEPSPLDALDAKTAAHVTKLRKEAATHRAALQAATAEMASLTEWKQGRMRHDVEQMAAGQKMIQPAEVWHVATMADFLDPDTGDISEAKVAEVIAAKVPSHWRVQPRTDYRRTRAPMSGATGMADIRSTTWSQALGPNER